MLGAAWKQVPSIWANCWNERLNITVAVVTCLLLSFYYLFQLTAGTYGPLVYATTYYDMMCEGFRQGHLYIPIAPSPELLAKPNPFAFENESLWIWDASLYNRHYYMYWGPVPGLCLLLWKVLTGHTKAVIDQWIGYPFVLGRLYAGAWLIVQFANYSRMRQRPWVVVLSIAAFGLASPTPFTVARMHVYEASLIAAQCFLLGGLVFAHWALTHENRRTTWLALASVCWGLAIGSRAAASIAVPLMILSTAVILWHREQRSCKVAFRRLLALGIPAASLLMIHMWYNHARFNSFTDFGVGHQVTKQPYGFSSVYVIPNMFAYAFTPLDWSCRFPFAVAPTYRKLSSLINWPAGYLTFERVIGMFTSASITWLLVLLLWRFGVYVWQRARCRTSDMIAPISWLEAWLLLCNLANVLTLWPALGLWEASARYLGDAISGFLLASILAGFWVLRRVDLMGEPKPRVWTHVVFAALTIQTCFVGAFSGIATYADAWQLTNPKLYGTLEKKLSVCADSKP